MFDIRLSDGQREFQRLTGQGLELFGGMGVMLSMPVGKYVRHALVQNHISLPFMSRFRVT